MKRILKFLFKFLVVVLILGSGVYTAVWFIQTRPKAKKTMPKVKPLLVDVMIARKCARQVIVKENGVVLPAKTIVVQPQVSGRIVEQSSELVPGGHFKTGDVIARIDPRDYQFAVEQQKAKVEKALFDLTEEEGRQTIAAREWKLLGSDVETTDTGRDLALRKPQLRYAKAALAAATSALDEAKLNLERTTIRAPFNALVLEEFVDIGQLVSPQTKIAKLVGTDEFWVQVSVSVDRLPWIRIPQINGSEESPARVIRDAGMGSRVERAGHVARLLGNLTPAGRMARVLVTVEDPLGLDSANDAPGFPLLIQDYVRVEMEGRMLENIFVIPRTALREGNQVWLMDAHNRLVIRNVRIVWREEKTVWIDQGIEEGDRIVISAITTPLPGMLLRVSKKNEERSMLPVIKDMRQRAVPLTREGE